METNSHGKDYPTVNTIPVSVSLTPLLLHVLHHVSLLPVARNSPPASIRIMLVPLSGSYPFQPFYSCISSLHDSIVVRNAMLLPTALSH